MTTVLPVNGSKAAEYRARWHGAAHHRTPPRISPECARPHCTSQEGQLRARECSRWPSFCRDAQPQEEERATTEVKDCWLRHRPGQLLQESGPVATVPTTATPFAVASWA